MCRNLVVILRWFDAVKRSFVTINQPPKRLQLSIESQLRHQRHCTDREIRSVQDSCAYRSGQMEPNSFSISLHAQLKKSFIVSFHVFGIQNRY